MPVNHAHGPCGGIGTIALELLEAGAERSRFRGRMWVVALYERPGG